MKGSIENNVTLSSQPTSEDTSVLSIAVSVTAGTVLIIIIAIVVLLLVTLYNKCRKLIQHNNNING